ncbi:hydantoinase B/oxoprolinase family protein [Amycolatopsis jejuensis]|uniref:hydantoinase B/oxoprolinase family protein n=1 Tax=Amycolatopsis jejuensis TaxID=330084 RepID=UPI000A5A9828|nr:hydantoinase B/oxoprolinase family protein [Amycolatopsis jejuensis]
MPDPITAEIVRNAMDTAAATVYETLTRTSKSPAVNEGKDCGAGVYGYDGTSATMISRAGIVLHSFAGLTSAQTALDFFRGDLDPGDVLLVSDSYHGGSHIGDYTVLVPIFFDGKPLFFTATRLHVADQGGPFPANGNPDCREIWHEGYRLAPVKLYEKGARRREIWDWLRANNRLPDLLESDLTAMIGASRMGERRVREVCSRYGLGEVLAALDWIFGYSERRFATQVREWPDGTYQARVGVDSDFQEARDLRIQVAVTVDGDRMAFDFTGTDAQTDGSINSVASNSVAWICVALSAMCPTIPINSGFFRALDVHLPPGSLVNAQEPAATQASTLCCGGQIGQAVMKACEQFAPERAGNVTLDLCGGFVMGLDTRNGVAPFMMFDSTPSVVSNSAAHGTDGWGCWATPFSVASPINSEMTELHYPVLFRQSEYATDSAAPGRWRGSPAFVTRRTMRGAQGTASALLLHSLVHPLCGYAGGYEGTGNYQVIDENGADETVVGAGGAQLTPFDPAGVVLSHSGGGGGWGDPLDRDPAQVLDDVLDEYISVTGALADYGVHIDSRAGVVLAEATARERSARRVAGPRPLRGIGRTEVIRRTGIGDRLAAQDV